MCTSTGDVDAYAPSDAANAFPLYLQGRCGSGGATVTVTVTDMCPECAAPTQGEGDHFDLNALSFNQLAPMLNGRIDVNYRLVACTPPSSLKVQVDGSGGAGLWLRLLITVSHLPFLGLLFSAIMFRCFLFEPSYSCKRCPSPSFLPCLLPLSAAGLTGSIELALCWHCTCAGTCCMSLPYNFLYYHALPPVSVLSGSLHLVLCFLASMLPCHLLVSCPSHGAAACTTCLPDQWLCTYHDYVCL